VHPSPAPELGSSLRCPWLTRTAGRIVWRPGARELILARLTAAFQDALLPGFGAMASAAAQAAAAFVKFGAALAKAGMVPPTTPEGESTATKVA
jgi:hypothetical protein